MILSTMLIRMNYFLVNATFEKYERRIKNHEKTVSLSIR